MHRHLYHRVHSARSRPFRPAKVVQLEARRQARLDVARDLRLPPGRPAA
jgi:hypothetical protein